MHLKQTLNALALAIAVVVTAPLSLALAQTPSCVGASEAEVALLSDRWSNALAGGRLDELVTLYADDAMVVAEGRAEPLKGRTQIRAYLAGLAERHAKPRLEMRSAMAKCGMATEMSVVRFEVTGVRKGTRMFLGGRVSTVFAHDGKSWQIVQQSLPTMSIPNRAR